MTDNTTGNDSENQSLEGPDVEVPTHDDEDGTRKPNGLGPDGTVPNAPDGIAAGIVAEPSHFNQEEDQPST